MRLLYITNGITGSGGLERVLSIKASYLADRMGYDVHILSLNEKDAIPFYEFSRNIQIHSMNASRHVIPYFCGYIVGLRKVVKEIHPDIISVCDDGLKGFFVPLFISKPCPMIYERHVSKNISANTSTLFHSIKTNLIYRLMDLGGRLYDKFVVLTAENRYEWRFSHIEVISNPLPFYPDETSSLQQKRVISVGKLSYQKAQDLLIKAWDIVAKKHPDWRLDIYGKQENLPSYQQQIAALNLQNNVFLHKPVSTIKDEYLTSSVYVLSSRYEGFGMVLAEAMACGLPCVSFDCPYGPSDIIHDGVDGLLVKNGNIIALSDSLLYLIENENSRLKMGAKAKDNVKRYLPENIIQQWDRLFNQLLLKR